MKPSVPVRLTLEKPVYGGDCMAHAEGKALLLPLTLPGETVSAHVTESKRNFATAEADAILVPSVERIEPECPYFGACGGCSYQHAAYAAQLDLKQQILRETLARAGIDFAGKIGRLAAQPWQYRNRIRLALNSDDRGRIRLSYRSRRSHDLIVIEECPISAPLLVSVAVRLAEWLSAHDNPVPIVEMELFCNQDESQMLLTLFAAKEGPRPARDLQGWLADLQSELPREAIGVRLQVADGSLAPPVLAATGKKSLTYTVAGTPYEVDHGAFFQVNRWLLEEFVAFVLGDLPAGRSAWDLYAGVGLFARRLLEQYPQVTAVESAPVSYGALERNLAAWGAAATIQTVQSTTFDYLRRNRQEREPRPDLIVLDPPRAGLGDDTTVLLNAIQAPCLVYVSCDPTTLARDLRALTRERYRIEAITQVDMFPQTFHMETVVRLRHS